MDIYVDELDAELAELPVKLSAVGYSDFISCHAHRIFERAFDRTMLRRSSEFLDLPLRRVVELFLLNEAVRAEDLPESVAEMMPRLVRAGIVDLDAEGCCKIAGLVLLYVHGIWLFVQPPQFYLGQDSLALADRLSLRPGKCLDLCAGPGFQALLCAQRGHPVVAVEINSSAVALCRANFSINGFMHLGSIRCADLYEGVPGEKFDNVVANPPFMPMPDSSPYLIAGDGGPDGLRITRRILAGLPEHLTPHGRAQAIGIGLSDGHTPLMISELSEIAASCALDISVVVTAHIAAGPGSDFVRGVAGMVARHSGHSLDQAAAVISEGYASEMASHVCPYTLYITLGSGMVRSFNLSGEEDLYRPAILPAWQV